MAHNGVYVATPNIKTVDDIYENGEIISPDASGVFIRVQWDMLQPGPDKWNWPLLDIPVDAAVAADKNISIGLIAGAYVPDWVGDKLGARYSLFTVEQRGCWEARIYHPWDELHMEAYLNAHKAIKARLRDKAIFKYVTMAKMSYLAQHTLEMRLPRRRAGMYGDCYLTDAIPIWQHAGYRPSLVRSAYGRVLDGMINIYRGRTISQALLHGLSFPRIDEDGRYAPQWVAEDLKLDLIEQGILKLGRDFSVNHTALWEYADTDELIDAYTNGASIGWQTQLWGGNSRAGCHLEEGGPVVPCTEELYGAMLRHATQAGASHLELWPADVAAFGPVVREADSILKGVAT